MDNKALIKYLEHEWMIRDLSQIDESILHDAYSIEDIDPTSRVPFIILDVSESYLKIVNLMKANQLSLGQVGWIQVNRKAETEFHFDNFGEFKKTTVFLKAKNVKYKIFTISDKNPLEIIIRGLPLILNIDQVKNALKEKGFHILKTTRRVGKANIPTTSVEVHLKEFQSNNIFSMTELLGLSRVSVEAITTEDIKKEQANASTSCEDLKHLFLPESLIMLRKIKSLRSSLTDLNIVSKQNLKLWDVES
ncbi:uncharacterized protein LOC143921330 [Arctopsyche grandis]|uniref:uncharacterized protein LOC143921330 n=1 Tax=Arctopsyche grandis TaxID=121162 RepID=UPI00406D845C